TIVHGEQVVQGVREGLADVASGLATTVMNPVGTAIDVGKAMGDAYTKGGGGFGGVVDAANVVNPLYHAGVASIEAYKAAERGDYKSAGQQGALAAADVAATVALVDAGAGVAGRLARAGEAGQIPPTLRSEPWKGPRPVDPTTQVEIVK